jgi:hypothetical protein
MQFCLSRAHKKIEIDGFRVQPSLSTKTGNPSLYPIYESWEPCIRKRVGLVYLASARNRRRKRSGWEHRHVASWRLRRELGTSWGDIRHLSLSGRRERRLRLRRPHALSGRPSQRREMRLPQRREMRVMPYGQPAGGSTPLLAWRRTIFLFTPDKWMRICWCSYFVTADI